MGWTLSLISSLPLTSFSPIQYNEQTNAQAASIFSSLATPVRKWAYLTPVFQHVLLPLSEKDSMVLHYISARKPKMLDNNDLRSCSATRLAEKHFITPAVPESIRT